MSHEQTCPTCGQRVDVAGDLDEGTMHFVGIEAREAVEAFLTGQRALEREVERLRAERDEWRQAHDRVAEQLAACIEDYNAR